MKKFIKHKIFAPLALGILMVSATAQAASINGMNVKTGAYTRITLDADQALTHKVMMLDNPSRLVLDIENAPANGIVNMIAKHDWSKHRYISQSRTGEAAQGKARIVFDLKSNVTHHVSNGTSADANKKHQLILDIFKVR